MEPEPTQHNRLEILHTPDKEVKNNHITAYGSGYTEPDSTVWPNKIGLFRAESLARHLLQLAYNSRIRAVDKIYLIELVRDMPPFSGPKRLKYYNRDLEPKRWDEIREKIN